jgi:hypothetical protein
MQYQLEWYYYFESINEKEVGIKWLKNAEISVSDSSLNRFTLNTKITIYRKLADYYQFRNFDTCLNYYIKVLNLEIKAKEEWGDYVIHQYAEIAKLLVSTENPFNYEYANIYCLKALDEFERAYGKESNFYKSDQATLGRLNFLISKGKYGINEMTPLVYSQLNNELFVPPLNTSVFEIYGDMLNQVDMPDSADFFYNQIYLRNSISTSLFRILGQTQDYQLKSLN